MRNTVSKGADFKSLYFPLRNEESRTDLYTNLEVVYRREVVKRKNFAFKNVFILMLERFHHVLYLPCRHKVLEKLILLRPPTSFYYMMNLVNLMFLWPISILITGAQYDNGIELTLVQAIMWGVVVGFIGSLITFVVTYFAHRYYATEVKRVFYKEIEEEQDRLNEIAKVQIQHITSSSHLLKDVTEIKDSEMSHLEESKINADIEEDQNDGLDLDKLEYKGKQKSKKDDPDQPKIIKKQDTYKEQSVLNMHTKRRNAIKHLVALRLDNQSNQSNMVEKNYFSANPMRETQSIFFKEDQEAKYKIKNDKNSVGDKVLFMSEMARSTKSKPNCISCILMPFFVLVTGLCAMTMFIYDDSFAQNVLAMVI